MLSDDELAERLIDGAGGPWRLVLDVINPPKMHQPLNDAEWRTVGDRFGTEIPQRVRDELNQILSDAFDGVQWRRLRLRPAAIRARLQKFLKGASAIMDAINYPGTDWAPDASALFEEAPDGTVTYGNLGTVGAAAWRALINGARSGDAQTRAAMRVLGDPIAYVHTTWMLAHAATCCLATWDKDVGGILGGPKHVVVRIAKTLDAANLGWSYWPWSQEAVVFDAKNQMEGPAVELLLVLKELRPEAILSQRSTLERYIREAKSDG